MALFADGPPSSIEDLASEDSQVVNVANVEGIDLTQKLEVVQAELGLDLQSMLARAGYIDQPFRIAAAPSLARVVVTPALKLWHIFRTLEAVYADAYSNQLNDRYGNKRDSYRTRSKWACDALAQLGIGLAANPVPRASAPAIEACPGSLTDATYYVGMAWVNGAGEEGACSEPTSVGIAGKTFRAQPGIAPRDMVGWHVYAGTDPDTLMRQNTMVISISAAWVQPAPLRTTGPAPGPGQTPSYMFPTPRVIQRG